MSILPYLRLLDELSSPNSSIYDQDFGLGMYSDDLIQPRRIVLASHPHYLRQWQNPRNPRSGVSSVKTTGDQFSVSLDVQQFRPDEMSVKVVDNSVVIEGKHEERRDEHGFISRQFQRRYQLPEGVDPTTVASSLSSDGVLSITAAKKQKPLPENERAVPIVQTNQTALKNEEGPKKTDGSGDKMEQ